MRARFTFAVVLTVFAVSYVVVPRIARFVDSVSGYNPAHYEPKDFDREQWLRRQEDPDVILESISGETLVSIVLVLLVVLVWLTLVPERAPRRRPPSR